MGLVSGEIAAVDRDGCYRLTIELITQPFIDDPHAAFEPLGVGRPRKMRRVAFTLGLAAAGLVGTVVVGVAAICELVAVGEEFDDLAEEFGVSTQIIRYQIENTKLAHVVSR